MERDMGRVNPNVMHVGSMGILPGIANGTRKEYEVRKEVKEETKEEAKVDSREEGKEASREKGKETSKGKEKAKGFRETVITVESSVTPQENVMRPRRCNKWKENSGKQTVWTYPEYGIWEQLKLWKEKNLGR